MNKKRQKKTSLKSSILLLLLLAILLITSSYAWFTANKTVTVSTLTVNVQAANGLQISSDGKNWKAVLSNLDLTNPTDYASHINQIPSELSPVSTSGAVTDGNMDMFYGTVETNDKGEYILVSEKQTDTAGTTGHYIVFDMFLKVNAPTDIDLTTASGVKSSTVQATEDNGLYNAARIAFVNEGTVADSSALATIQGQSMKTGTAMIWEPNYDTHTGSAKANAISDYGKTDADFTETGTGTGIFTAEQFEYYGVNSEFAKTDNVAIKQPTAPSSTYFSPVTPDYSTINGFTDNQEFLQLQAGITKLRVYMWVEGQDVDCENGASGTWIDFDLQLTVHGSGAEG